ncbi:MAG: hypothetical protein EOM25_10840 [Deltaproteobacteria bacterium]|nr:hypothetical protein [Deltaproteobacteria bacterium]
MNFIIRLFCVVAAASFTIGCANQVPHPVTYEYSEQQKMQAAYHWDLLAKDVAEDIHQAFMTKIGSVHSIYLAQNTSTQFNKAFYELLSEALIDRGMTIKLRQDGSMHIEYNVQMLYHPERNNQMSHGWRQTSMPHREVIVTASVIDGNICLAKVNSIYYINDLDQEMYRVLRVDTGEKDFSVTN